MLRECQATYQSECGDQRAHERHWVEVHWWRQAGQTPPVSNVFHSFPQLQDHRSSLRGDQPHSGQRMRGPDGSRSCSRSRSGTMTGLSATGLMPDYYGVPQYPERSRTLPQFSRTALETPVRVRLSTRKLACGSRNNPKCDSYVSHSYFFCTICGAPEGTGRAPERAAELVALKCV